MIEMLSNPALLGSLITVDHFARVLSFGRSFLQGMGYTVMLSFCTVLFGSLFALVLAVSMLLGVLEKGADTLQTRMAVPASISDIITGIFLFCMLGCEFFINYQIILRGRNKEG